MGKIRFDKRNYRKHNERNKELIAKSLTECGAGRSILLDADDSIIAGNGVYEQASKKGIPVRVIETDGTELIAVKRTDIGEHSEKRKKLALADNATSDSSEWDVDAIMADLSPIEVEEWDIQLPIPATMQLTSAEDEWAEIERKKAEFEEKMKAGELDEDDPEYQEFLAKFEAKKTTDDCYTPELVYDAVADWVANEYHVSRANFVRPFYPNGDYQREKYKPTDIVVDNPPFSILSEILKFYTANGIRFFLFAPTLTLFSSSSSSTALPCGAAIIYENGASVNTSFLTNLEPDNVRLRSCPELYAAVKTANDENLKQMRKELPKYSYDAHVVTATFVAQLSKYGIPFSVPVCESLSISELDAQKASKKAIYGKGYLVSDRAAAEKAAAEKAAAEKAAAQKWELSERERELVEKLNKKQGKK